MIYECVINVSEGTNLDILNGLRQSIGSTLVDVHSDVDHNRSVFTLASYTLDDVVDGAHGLLEFAHNNISLDRHEGVHPRLGAVDVVPFVSYDDDSLEPSAETISAAHELGKWANVHLDIPVFFYDHASETHTTLPFVRKNAFRDLEPDLDTLSHTRFGAVCVGARRPLIAINVNLDTENEELAKTIAREIRESSGGIAGVRAIGLKLFSRSCVQVSMNIVDTRINVEDVYTVISDRAHSQEVSTMVELVGLVPRFQYDLWSTSFRNTHGLSESHTIESHLDN